MTTGLVQEEIDGRTATVAYLDAIGGNFVEKDKARVVIVRFNDTNEVHYLYPQKIADAVKSSHG